MFLINNMGCIKTSLYQSKFVSKQVCIKASLYQSKFVSKRFVCIANFQTVP